VPSAAIHVRRPALDRPCSDALLAATRQGKLDTENRRLAIDLANTRSLLTLD
jgi:hypothetical protein